jgi:hypothetical protein
MKITNIRKESIGALILGLAVAAIAYAVFVFSFYDVYILSRAHLAETKMQAVQVNMMAGLKADAIFRQHEFIAHSKLLKIQAEHAGLLTEARKRGFPAYLKAFNDYQNVYGQAKRDYAREMRLVKIETDFLKREARSRSSRIMREARLEFDPLVLLVMGRVSSQGVVGYFYDPKTGKVVPRLKNQLNITKER